MRQLFRWIAGCSALALCLALASGVQARTVATGDFHMGEYDRNCFRLNDTMERNYPNYTPLAELSFAFYGGFKDNQDLCLTSLFEPGGLGMDGVALLISELEGGMVLEELTTPQGTNPGPLEDCWPSEIHFDDLNSDGTTDILLMIGCYNGEADRPENENVVYLSTVSEGSVWLRQSEEMNRVVGSMTNSGQAAQAVRVALGIDGGPWPSSAGAGQTPTPPSSPPPSFGAPAPPPGPPPSNQEACSYNTEWGVLTLLFDFSSNSVNGNYEHMNGELSGLLQGDAVNGLWVQSDGQGHFSFTLSQWGFQGKWNYERDLEWRGDWNGQLIRCWQP